MHLNTPSVMFLGSSGVLDLATLYSNATGNPATVDLPGGNLKEWLPPWNFKWLWVVSGHVMHVHCSCQFSWVYQHEWLHHLTALLRWWPSWKMSTILKFKLAMGSLLSSYPWRLLPPINRFWQVFISLLYPVKYKITSNTTHGGANNMFVCNLLR